MDRTWIMSMVVPGDRETEEKEREKMEKYQNLARKIQWLWKTSASLVLIVVGALGAVASVNKYMGMLDIEQRKVGSVQFSV